MEPKKQVELVTSELTQIQARVAVKNKLEAELREKSYMFEAVDSDINAFIRKLAAKHGLMKAKDYVVENGMLKVDEESLKKSVVEGPKDKQASGK